MYKKSGYVYIMTNGSNKTLYVGVTTDLIKRVYEHKNKINPNSFTSKYNISKLVYFEDCLSIENAISKEKKIKSGNRQKKIDLINSINPNWEDLYNAII